MFFRTLGLIALALLALPAAAQNRNNNISQAFCPTDDCLSANNFSVAPGLPSTPVRGKWKVEDFEPSDASVSCSVVSYDVQQLRPVVHLLCPGPQIFAPLRVHLALSFKNDGDIPDAMRHMLVDVNSQVKFKSRPGDSRAELTLHDPRQTRSLKTWITFSQVKVGLVLPQQK
ncbi:MAG TPA: hypothetical protein VLT16_11065 [Candidatus Limnocylindrales bacterium]|nr:hypothetical protein [Candidatus Limnocylindrales bacterium]